MKKFCKIAFLALALSLTCSTSAFAQGDNEVEGGGEIKLDLTEIRGKRQLPGAVYILKNKDLSYDRIELGESFLDRIDETTSQDPF